MDERIRFISDYLNQYFTITELCERYNISRTTGYKWIQRYLQEGTPEVLLNQSQRPLHSPTKTSDEIEKEILSLRSKHPSWGAKKLLWRMKKDHPD